MNTKVFLQKINELKEALSLPNTFRNRFRKRKLRKQVDKMVREAAIEQAKSMYKQAYDFYQDIVNNFFIDVEKLVTKFNNFL